MSLTKQPVERTLSKLESELGKTDQVRLGKLVGLIPADGRIRLSEALSVLFPSLERADALTAFRQFRARVNAAATAAGHKLTLEADTQTRTAPNGRWCWFEGEDSAVEAATDFVERATRNTLRIGQDAIRVGRRKVKYFLSYAHADQTLKAELLKRLGDFLAVSPSYDFQLWHDNDILVGKDWNEQIQAAIEDCDCGILLVSPAFLASDYITREELHHFVCGPKPGIPVALAALRFDGTMDLKGLGKQQIFHHVGKAFQERGTPKTRQDFCSELFAAIIHRLDDHFGNTPNPEAPPPAHDWQRHDLEHDLHDVHFIAPHGHLGTMRKFSDSAEAPEGERQDALKFLLDWAREADGPPCCALLGSVGIGKTTTSKAFAHQLLTLRAGDEPRLPQPIYLDLRHLGEAAKAEPDLTSILAIVLRRSWTGGQTSLPMTPEEVIRLVRHDGAIVIFDGLDEVLVHLSQQGGQVFTRELLRILPPALWPRNRRAEEPGRPGRVMVTCRTHYFRSLREQQTHLTLEDRDDVGDRDYRVLVLLPFNDEQIREYLTQVFPEQDVMRLLDTINSVHNLPELATRPYTLKLIGDALPEIERWRIEGKRVTGVDLYRHMVEAWLERDSGKHEFDIDHKQRIMEHVAAELWKTGGRTWTARQMEDWLAEFLDTTLDVARHYRGTSLDLLKKDLRTATFLVGGGTREFRFAHTSLQEFFLAAYLLRALRERRFEAWDINEPSRETLDFLGQMMLKENDGIALATLRQIGAAYRPGISERGFAYILFARTRGYPAPEPTGFVLDGADLRGWRIEGPQDGPLLNLRSSRFRGARLNEAVFRHVDLTDADLSGADLTGGELNGGIAKRIYSDNAMLCGCSIRGIDLSLGRFNAANMYRTQILRCVLDGTSGLANSVPALFIALCEQGLTRVDLDHNVANLRRFSGHASAVNNCAFSPDGTRIASASDDNTLRIWDAVSGDCIKALNGHTNWVMSCAFSPDGSRIVSASYDNTLRIWDAVSGDCCNTLNGHASFVRACTFSPDGTRIVSASDDNTLGIWDAVSGDRINTLNGHTRSVRACAFSPDGTRIASASYDKTFRIWDALSGDCINTLYGQTPAVTSCAFSPDGTRIVCGSDDNTLRVLDAVSGDCINTLNGHSDSVNACASAPDGKHIASASSDNTLRIWDAVSGDCINTLNGHTRSVLSCTFSPDGTRIVSASDDNTLRIWDAVSGDCINTLNGHSDSVNACAFSPDGTRIASASDDNTLRIWGAVSGDCINTLDGHTNCVMSCVFSPDGTRIASASYDNTLRIWEAASGHCLQTLNGHTSTVYGCAFASDGRTIVSASEDDTLRIWDAVSGDCVNTLKGHSDWVRACVFASDGTRIVSASDDNTLRIWDVASGHCTNTLKGHSDYVRACAFSPDGRRIVSASEDETLRIWDAVSGDCIKTLHGHSNSVLSCAFSTDGTRIASGASDNTLRIWDAVSGDCIKTLKGHTNSVVGCAFAPDGRTIASASDDGTLRVWDAASGEPTGFQAHLLSQGGVASLSADGTRILFANDEAWRDLGWLIPDATGELIRYPAETFGPLPPMKAG